MISLSLAAARQPCLCGTEQLGSRRLRLSAQGRRRRGGVTPQCSSAASSGALLFLGGGGSEGCVSFRAAADPSVSVGASPAAAPAAIPLQFAGGARSGGVQFRGSGGGSQGSVSFGASAATQPSSGGGLSSLRQRLQSFGLAGLLAYGLFNSLYYCLAFLGIWLYVAKVPSGQGAAAAGRAFITVFLAVWAGSQATKLVRAGGALLLAPLVAWGLDVMQARLRLKSQRQAFLLVVGACLAAAALLFGGVVLAWS